MALLKQEGRSNTTEAMGMEAFSIVELTRRLGLGPAQVIHLARVRRHRSDVDVAAPQAFSPAKPGEKEANG